MKVMDKTEETIRRTITARNWLGIGGGSWWGEVELHLNRNRTNHTLTHMHTHTYAHTHTRTHTPRPYTHVCRDRYHAGPYSSTLLLLRSSVPDGQWRDKRVVTSTSSMAPVGLKLFHSTWTAACCLALLSLWRKQITRTTPCCCALWKYCPTHLQQGSGKRCSASDAQIVKKLPAVGGSFGIFGRTQLSASLATSWVQSLWILTGTTTTYWEATNGIFLRSNSQQTALHQAATQSSCSQIHFFWKFLKGNFQSIAFAALNA